MFRFDLHLHSCLSPCANLSGSPRALSRAASLAGLHGVMLADHNSSRNSSALAEACRREGLACLFGMELSTAEEAHCLVVFDTLDQAVGWMEKVDAALPARANVPWVFGEQPVVTADDEVEGFETRLLSAPTSLTIPEAAAAVHAIGGLFIAAHVDRPVFSVMSQLGAISGEEGFDAVEVSRHGDPAIWRERVAGLPIIRSSDAHDLDEVGAIWSEADLADFSVGALRAAFLARAVGWGEAAARTAASGSGAAR